MSNKGALAVTNLIDEVPGMSGLIFNKVVIPENDLGYGGLSFKVGNELKYIEYDLFLNYNDLYDLTIGGEETLENQFVGNVYNLFNWLTQIHYNKAK